MNDFQSPDEATALIPRRTAPPTPTDKLYNSKNGQQDHSAPIGDPQVQERLQHVFSIWPNRDVLGYPPSETNTSGTLEVLPTMTLVEAFETRHNTPALIPSYSVHNDVSVRLNNGYLDLDIQPTFELFWIDIDNHDDITPEAFESWMVGERVKVEALQEKHSGKYYATEHGYRIDWLMRETLTINTDADLDRLRIDRAKSILYLCSEFGLDRLDVTCIEPLRGHALPLIRKGDKDLNLPRSGQWAFWDVPSIDDKDIKKRLDALEKSAPILAKKISGKLTRQEITFDKTTNEATAFAVTDISEGVDNFIIGCSKFPSTERKGGEKALYDVAVKLFRCWGLSGGEALYYMREYNKYSKRQDGSLYPWPDSKLIRTIANAERATYCNHSKPYAHDAKECLDRIKLQEAWIRNKHAKAKEAREDLPVGEGKKPEPEPKTQPENTAYPITGLPVIDAFNKEFFAGWSGVDCDAFNYYRIVEGSAFAVAKESIVDSTASIKVPCGEGKLKSGFKHWNEHPARRSYDRVHFAPMQTVGDNEYNLFSGYAVKPISGSWALLKDHWFHVICNGNEEFFRWFFAWCANMFQRPHDKPGTSIVIFGETEGTGKGFFIRVLFELLGKGLFMQEPDSEALFGRFNSHLERTLLVNPDEALWSGDKKMRGKIKNAITEPERMIEHKGGKRYAAANYTRFIITSNNKDAVHLDRKERRFAVTEVNDCKAVDTDYFKKLQAELSAGGYEALMYDLMNYDLAASGINLRVVPKTKARADMIREAWSVEEQFWFEILDSGCLPDFSSACGDLYFDANNQAVSGSVLHETYKKIAQSTRGSNVLTPHKFFERLRALCPTMGKGKPTRSASMGVIRAHALPKLHEARAAFETVMGKVNWTPQDNPTETQARN